MSNNIPKLRFPGFTGEWEEKKLGEVVSVNRGVRVTRKDLTEKGIYPVFQNTNSPMGYYDLYNVSANNPFVIIGGSAGVMGFCRTNFWAADDCAYFGDSKLLDKYFLYSTLLLLEKDIKNNVRGGNIPRIDRNSIEKLKISLPSLPEQEKIAGFLTEMDNLIAAQGEKVEALKEKKKGLMQQLFPQPGQNTPQLRFPGFTGEWEYVYGNELFDSVSNKKHNSDLPILALTQDQGAVPREMIDYNIYVTDKSIAGYKVVEIDDFIISLRSFQGGIEYSRYKGLCSPAYIVLRKKERKTCSDFYRIYFKSYNYIQELNRNLEGIRDGKMISYNQFSEIKLPKPSLPEQQKIASCLSALDDLIAAESEKLEYLKSHKKGLMQQLFPQPEK